MPQTFFAFLFATLSVIFFFFLSVKGSYLSACLHYLAVFGPDATVIGNSEYGGLNEEDATQIQVLKYSLTCQNLCVVPKAYP